MLKDPEGGLAVRPIFHQLGARIEPHTSVAFLAYYPVPLWLQTRRRMVFGNTIKQVW